MALVGRALGGALNGNMGVIQTMVGEMITNPKHERKYTGATGSVQTLTVTQPKHTLSCHLCGQ